MSLLQYLVQTITPQPSEHLFIYFFIYFIYNLLFCAPSLDVTAPVPGTNNNKHSHQNIYLFILFIICGFVLPA